MHKCDNDPSNPDTIVAFPVARQGEPSRFINRELSWLAFNGRVLEEANNPHVPLLERINFLSICASNLDEFTMVRIAGLKDQIRHAVLSPSADGLSPREQLNAIRDVVSELIDQQQQCWLTLRDELQKQHIAVIEHEELSESEKRWLRRYFSEQLFPLLTPIAIDPAHPFPFIPNLGMACLFELSDGAVEHIAMVSIPHRLSRFIALKQQDEHRAQRFIPMEEVIHLCFDLLFPGFKLKHQTMFRIIRDSDLDIEEDAEDLVRTFEKAVKERRRGRVVRVKMKRGTPAKLRRFILQNLQVDPEDCFEVDGMIGVNHISELYKTERNDLKFTPFEVRFPERINEFGGDCFAAIQAKDIVVHHPYESFDVVVRFIEQAASDPDVVSIKQTLYRTSKNSPIVRALIEAAEAGKSVTALIELKARFDEEANIRWARDMERAGVQVVYGFVSLKTHAKVSLVVRQEGKRLRSYVHFGTGNYHPMTAKIYTDLSYFTCDQTLCRDAAHLFNYMTGYAKPKQLKQLSIAPTHMRDRLFALIEQEMDYAKAGQPAHIWAKMNALIDPAMIDKLYQASQAGVQIDLIVRGICGLRPGITGLSENIRVKSIVGRFLEHARIYCFGGGHGLPAGKAKLFIASADWMTRNFDHRVEVMVPITNETVHAQIMDQIMVANLRDERQSWVLQSDGSYQRLRADGEGFCAHDYFMHNPSLSGRGRALQQGNSPPRIALAQEK